MSDLATTVERVAVLLGAGVPPAAAWSYVGASPNVSPLVDAACDVATEVGAPLAPTLHGIAATLRDLAETERAVQTALAGPRATTRLVMVLPVIGLLFGTLLGVDSLHVLVTTPVGLLGALLMLAAWVWSRQLVRRARVSGAAAGLELDLISIAVSGGVSIARAREVVEAATARCGIPTGTGSLLDETLELSARAGVPAALLLRSAAEEERRDARGEGRRRAETLSVTLMLPLGLCVLPAFMLLGVAPLMISLVASTLGSL